MHHDYFLEQLIFLFVPWISTKSLIVRVHIAKSIELLQYWFAQLL